MRQSMLHLAVVPKRIVRLLKEARRTPSRVTLAIAPAGQSRAGAERGSAAPQFSPHSLATEARTPGAAALASGQFSLRAPGAVRKRVRANDRY